MNAAITVRFSRLSLFQLQFLFLFIVWFHAVTWLFLSMLALVMKKANLWSEIPTTTHWLLGMHGSSYLFLKLLGVCRIWLWSESFPVEMLMITCWLVNLRLSTLVLVITGLQWSVFILLYFPEQILLVCAFAYRLIASLSLASCLICSESCQPSNLLSHLHCSLCSLWNKHSLSWQKCYLSEEWMLGRGRV